MYNLQDPEILRAERDGSRDGPLASMPTCEMCKDTIDPVDNELCRDFAGQAFCGQECFLKYYGYRKAE